MGTAPVLPGRISMTVGGYYWRFTVYVPQLDQFDNDIGSELVFVDHYNKEQLLSKNIQYMTHMLGYMHSECMYMTYMHICMYSAQTLYTGIPKWVGNLIEPCG